MVVTVIVRACPQSARVPDKVKEVQGLLMGALKVP